MTNSPIDLLKERLKEIQDVLDSDALPDEEREKIERIQSEYIISIALLDFVKRNPKNIKTLKIEST